MCDLVSRWVRRLLFRWMEITLYHSHAKAVFGRRPARVQPSGKRRGGVCKISRVKTGLRLQLFFESGHEDAGDGGRRMLMPVLQSAVFEVCRFYLWGQTPIWGDQPFPSTNLYDLDTLIFPSANN